MTSEERRFILWGFREARFAARIGRELGVTEVTVRRFRIAFKKNPETLLGLGLREKSGADDGGHRYLVCGEASPPKAPTPEPIIIELRAFALARAINLPNVVITWAAIDGCDAPVRRLPHRPPGRQRRAGPMACLSFWRRSPFSGRKHRPCWPPPAPCRCSPPAARPAPA